MLAPDSSNILVFCFSPNVCSCQTWRFISVEINVGALCKKLGFSQHFFNF